MIKYMVLVLFCGMILMNYLANALPLNNMTTGQLSDSYPNLFVPAGLTFSIWGVIYLLLAVCCVLQFTRNTRDTMLLIGWAFAVTCILNSLWIIFWHYQLVPLSLLTMVGLLVTLIVINMRIVNLPYGIIKASFGIYLGWICIATIANVTALLVDIGWKGGPLSEVTWTIIMIFTGAAIAMASIVQFKNPFIGLSVIWAFIGIIIKRNSDYNAIVIAASLGIILVAVIVVLRFFTKVPIAITN